MLATSTCGSSDHIWSVFSEWVKLYGGRWGRSPSYSQQHQHHCGPRHTMDACSTFAEQTHLCHEMPQQARALLVHTIKAQSQQVHPVRNPPQVVFISWQYRPGKCMNHLDSVATALISLCWYPYALIPSLSPHTYHIHFSFLFFNNLKLL